MKPIKVLLPSIVSASLAFSATGCSSTTDWVMKTDKYTIGAGQYLYYITDKTSTAQTKLDDKSSSGSGSSESSKDFFKKEIDGKKVSDWIEDEALKESKNMLGASIEFDNLGLSFTDDENSKNDKNAKQNYYYNDQYDYYSEVGIGEDSYRDTVIEKAKYDKVFDAYYGANGKEAVSDEDKDAYTKEHGANYKLIQIDKNDDTNSSSSSSEGAESSESGSGSSSSDSSASDSSSADNSNNKTNAQKVEDYKTDIQNGKSIDDINTEWENSQGNSSPSALSNKFVFEKDDTQQQVILDGVFKTAQADGPPVVVEDDESYYIIQRYTPDQDTLQKHRDDALKYMKEDEFSQKLAKTADDNGFEKNKGAISKYSPQKQKEFQDKIKSENNQSESD